MLQEMPPAGPGKDEPLKQHTGHHLPGEQLCGKGAGVLLGESWAWDHRNTGSKEVSHILGFRKRSRTSREKFTCIYLAFVRSHLEYCIQFCCHWCRKTSVNWSELRGATSMVLGGVLDLWGWGAGLIQPGAETASGGPNSGPQCLLRRCSLAF